MRKKISIALAIIVILNVIVYDVAFAPNIEIVEGAEYDEQENKDESEPFVLRSSTHGAISAPIDEPIWEEKPNTETYIVVWADYLNVTLEDFDLMCHTVWCEAGNQSFEAQVKVARVILFRVIDPIYFADTIRDVIYEGNGAQFNVVNKPGFPEAYPYSDTTELAVFTAITEYPMEDRRMEFFRSDYYFATRPRYTDVDNMFFSLRGN